MNKASAVAELIEKGINFPIHHAKTQAIHRERDFRE
jgi:hypothetical protein